MKLISVIVAIMAMGLYGSTGAQPDAETLAEIERVCSERLCREPTPIRLKLPDGRTVELTPWAATPIVEGDRITVHAGETINIEATVENRRLVKLTAVAENTQPSRTLVFTLRQVPDIGDGTGMFLTVDSPFEEVVTYRLGMMLHDSDDFYATSVCPLHAGVQSIEHWPHPIVQIVATDFRVVPSASEQAGSCR